MDKQKPLGGKAYGHIPHLPGSRLGPGDHKCHEGQSVICTEKTRDKHDVIVVQEKLDGSCVSVARVEGSILALGRAGYLATTSSYEQHQLFAHWVRENMARFDALLVEGERVVGEWLALAHGTRYKLKHEPFVVFDIMRGKDRATHAECEARLGDFVRPYVVSVGPPVSIHAAMAVLGPNGKHGALDPVEGAVWRVERKGAVDFLAKYVRPDKADGCYLPEVGGSSIWHWRPERAA